MSRFDDYKHAMDMVKEVEQGPVSKFSAETRCFADLVRAVDIYHLETRKTEAKGKPAGMMMVRRDRGVDGWIVDYKTLEKVTAKACQVEPVSMEEAEAVILALVDEHFIQMEEE
jgi:hypothetical protein